MIGQLSGSKTFVDEIPIHPFKNEFPHLRKFNMGRIEQLDVAIRFPAIFAIEREQKVSDLLDTKRGSQGITSPIHAEVRSGHDQFIDVRRLEVVK